MGNPLHQLVVGCEVWEARVGTSLEEAIATVVHTAAVNEHVTVEEGGLHVSVGCVATLSGKSV